MFEEIYAEWKILFVCTFLVALAASYIASKRHYSRSFTRFIVSVLTGLLAGWIAAIAVGVYALGADTSHSLATVLGIFKFLGLVAVGVIPPVLVSLFAVLIGWWRGARRGRRLRAA